MAQQTAVEWLYNELTKVWYDVKSSQELLEQAKAMEKEQIINGHYAGWEHAYDYLRNEESNDAPIQAEEYYNETYESNT